MLSTSLPAHQALSPREDAELARVAADHEELAWRLDALDRLLSWRDGLGSARWEADLRGWVQQMYPRLREHYRLEERSPLYTSFIEEFPRFAGELERLRAEHQALNGELGELAARVEVELSPGVVQRLAAFAGRLRRHDALERDLMGRAYVEDLGGAD